MLRSVAAKLINSSALKGCNGAKVAKPLVSSGFLQKQHSFATVSSSSSLSYPQSLLNVPQTQVTRLPNGLTIATEANTSVETATVGVWIDSGSRAENKKNNGVAHFLEHMTFKGTPTRSQHSLEMEIENIGAHLNAYTSREHTVYYAKLFSRDLPKGISILSDILQKSTLEESAINRERDVILREAEEVSKQMEEVVFDHLHATCYQESPLGFTILGPEENIKSISKQDLQEYIKTNYTADRMVIVATGKVQHEEICKLAEDHFGKLPTGSGKVKYGRPSFVGSEIRYRIDEMPTAHIALAVEGCGWSNPDHWPLLVASSIVGTWDRSFGAAGCMSSRLAQVVANNDLANSFMSFNTTYSDTGLFGIYLQSNAKTNLDDLICNVQKEWIRLALNATEAEVERAKQQLKTSLLLSLDGTTPIAEEIGRQMLVFGRRITPFEVDRLVDSVTAEEVKRVAQKYIYDNELSIVSIGPVEGVPDYNRMISSMNSMKY